MSTLSRFTGWVVVRVVLLAPVVLWLGTSPAVAQLPQDAHSLCLPSGPPPEGGYEPYLGGVRERGMKVIGGVPAYLWRHGCGPTAAGMVIGYWDGAGYPLLILGDAATQTEDVNQAITSTAHYDDYSVPIDYPPDPIQPDKSTLGGAHSPHNCLGDFMRTSWSAADMYYGESWFSDVDDSLIGYTNVYVNNTYGASYNATASNETWGTFTWDTFRAEIDNDRPMVFLVDSDGDGWTDHFVTAIGYRDTNGYPEYACFDTWATGIRWERFREMSASYSWGIYGATYFGFVNTPEGMNVEPDDAINDTLPGPIWCLATNTGLVHTSGCTSTIGSANDYATNPGPSIGDGALTVSDVDIYKFTVSGGTPCVLIVNCARDLDTQPPATGALDPYVTLWSDPSPNPGDATIVAEWDDTAGNGCRGQDTQAVYLLQNTGTYYLGVTSLIGDGSVIPNYIADICGTQGANYTAGDYDLDITICSQGTPSGAEEENDTVVEADIKGNMTPGVPINGNIGNGKWGASSGDYDWYRFEVTQPCSLITARCQTDTIGSNLRPVVNIYDASCAMLNQAIHFDPHPADGMQDCPGDTICEWIVATISFYYVEVHGNGTGSQGDACMEAGAGNGRGSTGNYRLTVDITPPGGYPAVPDATEPNDWAAVAIPVPTAVCANCWVREDMFIGDGPCGCVPGHDTIGGDFDVYRFTLEPGCEVVICLQTTDRPEGDSQADLTMSIWPGDLPNLDDFLIFGLGDPICNGQCMWFCDPKDSEPSAYYLVVGGLDMPSNLQPDPTCANAAKSGVTAVGHYDIYFEFSAYLGNCQPAAFIDLCAEEGCAGANSAYLLRSFNDPCGPDDWNDPNNVDTEVADDFIVPPGRKWRICDIHSHFGKMGGTATLSDVPNEMRFRIYEGNRVGCSPPYNHLVPDQLIWEYDVTGFVECSKRYSRGWVSAFSNPTKYDPNHKCESSCGNDPFIELEEGTYWVSVVMSIPPADINGGAHCVLVSNRPTSPCFTPSNYQDAQWRFAAGWAAASPPPNCGTDWTSVRQHFIDSGIGDCDYDMALKLSGVELEIDSCCPCVGDIDLITGGGCDNQINIVDFTRLAASYGSQAGDPNFNPCADFNGNGFVNVADFSIFASLYSTPCP